MQHVLFSFFFFFHSLTLKRLVRSRIRQSTYFFFFERQNAPHNFTCTIVQSIVANNWTQIEITVFEILFCSVYFEVNE